MYIANIWESLVYRGIKALVSYTSLPLSVKIARILGYKDSGPSSYIRSLFPPIASARSTSSRFSRSRSRITLLPVFLRRARSAATKLSDNAQHRLPRPLKPLTKSSPPFLLLPCSSLPLYRFCSFLQHKYILHTCVLLDTCEFAFVLVRRRSCIKPVRREIRTSRPKRIRLTSSFLLDKHCPNKVSSAQRHARILIHISKTRKSDIREFQVKKKTYIIAGISVRYIFYLLRYIFLLWSHFFLRSNYE